MQLIFIFNTTFPWVYYIFSQKVIYTWGKGWCIVTEWLVPGVSVCWGHVLVPGNPGYDGVEGLTKDSPFPWAGVQLLLGGSPVAALGPVVPGMVPWFCWELRLSAPRSGSAVWLVLPVGLVASSQMSCGRSYIQFLVFIPLPWLSIDAKHGAAQVRRGDSVSMGETLPQNTCLRSCMTISTSVIIQNLL